jgi:lipopolysaccharide transport system permease protein
MTILGLGRSDLGMLRSLFKLALVDRFLGSKLGTAWAILSPLSLLALFTFVFTFVFPSRLPGHAGSLPFVIWLMSGYGPWLAINEGISSSTGSIVSNAGIIKNISFKSELLPIVGALLGLVPLAVSFFIIVPLQLFSGIWPTAAYLALPFVVLLQIVFVSGLGLFLAALNVFVRDTALALPTVLTLLLFASPIFYRLSSYPGGIGKFLVYNPIYVIADCFRAIVLDGVLPPLWMVLYLTATSALVFIGGLLWFRRLKPFFDTRL